MDGMVALDQVRPWRERAMLASTLAVFGLLVLWLSPLAAGLPVVLAAAWLVLGPVFTLLSGATLLHQATHVSPESLPNWHTSYEALLNQFAWPLERRPRLLVVQDPRLNASAQWWPRRPILTLTSGLVDALNSADDDAMRRAILGHELSHARWHVFPLMWVAGPPSFPVPGTVVMLRILSPLRTALSLATLAWSRQAEQAADRGALLGAGSLDAVASILTLVSTGVRPNGASGVRRQIQLHGDTSERWVGCASNLFLTHPLLTIRIRAISSFAISAEYGRLVRPDHAESQRWVASELGFNPDRSFRRR